MCHHARPQSHCKTISTERSDAALAWLKVMLALQELRKELDKERDDHAAAAARGDALQQRAEQLSREKQGLQEAREELDAENAKLRERAEALADSAEALLSEKYTVQKKVPQHGCLVLRMEHSTALSSCMDDLWALSLREARISRLLLMTSRSQRCRALLACHVSGWRSSRASSDVVVLQLESLQAESKREAAKRAEQEEELRRDVAEALESFGTGQLDAEGLLTELRDMGIEVECSAEQLTLLARCSP